MDRKRAAEVWAGLESTLIQKCGLPNGRMLDVERPGLIRRIGAALGMRNYEELRGVRRAAAVENVSPPLRMPAIQQARITHGTEVGSTIFDAKLAAMLERSCSRRSGYDGDDSVGYE